MLVQDKASLLYKNYISKLRNFDFFNDSFEEEACEDMMSQEHRFQKENETELQQMHLEKKYQTQSEKV